MELEVFAHFAVALRMASTLCADNHLILKVHEEKEKKRGGWVDVRVNHQAPLHVGKDAVFCREKAKRSRWSAAASKAEIEFCPFTCTFGKFGARQRLSFVPPEGFIYDNSIRHWLTARSMTSSTLSFFVLKGHRLWLQLGGAWEGGRKK